MSHFIDIDCLGINMDILMCTREYIETDVRLEFADEDLVTFIKKTLDEMNHKIVFAKEE